MRQVVQHGGLNVAVRTLSKCSSVLRSYRNEGNLTFLSLASQPQRAHYIAPFIPRPQPNPLAKNVAVLGGGITGLATAFNLADALPGANIVLYEAESRLGGWIESEFVDVDDGQVLFEWGPRTLRPDANGYGIATLTLIARLGKLMKDIRGTDRSAPAATNRYIYYPDHLVRLPAPNPERGMFASLISNVYTFFTEPIFRGIFTKLIAEPSIRTRAPNVADESVGDFLSRRFGKEITDNVASAVFHGIYAGNIYELSARTLLPQLWYMETRDPNGNGIVGELAELMFRQYALRSYDILRFHSRLQSLFNTTPQVAAMVQDWRAMSVYVFALGLAELPSMIEDELGAREKVKMLKQHKVESLTFNEETKQIGIKSTGDASVENYDYVVSTLSWQQMSRITSGAGQNKDSGLLSGITGSPSTVNVMVVNLYYQNPNLISTPGFGYLLPRSIPIDQNPERALGVIFGSETAGPRGREAHARIDHYPPSQQQIDKAKERLEDLKQQPNVDPRMIKLAEGTVDMLTENAEKGTWSEPYRAGQDTASGTKLTVMLGGHWWDGWASADLPSEADAIEMAKAVLARHLKITENPLVAKARLQKDCIPQYKVGYRQAMAQTHQKLLGAYKGRLKVAGPAWQGGVGVNDCCKKAHDTMLSIREQWDDHTGLEDYTSPEKWCIWDRRTNTYHPDPLQK